MTPLVPVMMYGWIVITILAFLRFPRSQAIAISVIGGFLILPFTSVAFPIIPRYSKHAAISFGLILAHLVSPETSGESTVSISRCDIPMFLWCIVGPLATSLWNGLGIRDGISSVMDISLTWGVYYWAGRRFFQSRDGLRLLTRWVILGGFVYAFLALYEIRMSPQLSIRIYGFFPHVWSQHVRYGGYRPIVFMQHALMVSLWFAVSYTTAYWHWRMKTIRRLGVFPIGLVVVLLLATGILCKSAAGWIFLLLGTVGYSLYRLIGPSKLLWILIAVVPTYALIRLTNIISVEFLTNFASRFIEIDRVQSLGIRLVQENLFGSHALTRPLFGWGGGDNRFWPKNPETGELMITMVDSLFIIITSRYGLFGLVNFFLALLMGPMLIARKFSRRCLSRFAGNPPAADAVVLSFVVVVFCIDCLMNGMINPIYTMISGALVSYARTIDASTPVSKESLGP